MKIAVTYDNGNIFQHFGHTESFKIYNIADNKVTESEIMTPSGSGHCALGGVLKEHGVDALICGGIGAGAIKALAESGITLYGGVKGSADEAVENLLSGNLAYSQSATCNHKH